MTQFATALRLSGIIQEVSPNPGENDIIAMAYATRNRIGKGGTLDDIIAEASLPERGQNSCQTAVNPADSDLKSLSLVTGVFAGLYDDPTRGATRFHRHDRTPSWAQGRVPNALLGSYMYYREENS